MQRFSQDRSPGTDVRSWSAFNITINPLLSVITNNNKLFNTTTNTSFNMQHIHHSILQTTTNLAIPQHAQVVQNIQRGDCTDVFSAKQSGTGKCRCVGPGKQCQYWRLGGLAVYTITGLSGILGRAELQSPPPDPPTHARTHALTHSRTHARTHSCHTHA